MTSPGQGAFRADRSVTVVLVSVLASLVAHRAGGGVSLPIAALTLLTLVTLLLVRPLSARPVTTSRVIGVIGVTQVGYHAALTSFSPAHATSTPPGSGVGAHDSKHLATPELAMSGTDPLSMVTSVSLPMLAAHGASCLVVALVLANADTVLRRLYGWLCAVTASTEGAALVLVTVRPAFLRAPVVPSRFFARCVAPGRAPPALLA